MTDLPLQQPHGIELLTLIFEMIEPRKLRLFEDDEFVSLHVDDGLVTESELQRQIFQILDSLMRSPFPFLLNDVCLQVCQLLESLLGALHHEISRLLQRNVMLALRMFYVLLFVLLQKSMLEGLLPVLLCCQHSKIFEELLLEILALNFLEVEICLQAVVELLLGGE